MYDSPVLSPKTSTVPAQALSKDLKNDCVTCKPSGSPPSLLDTQETTSQRWNGELASAIREAAGYLSLFSKVRRPYKLANLIEECHTIYRRFGCADCENYHDVLFTCNSRYCVSCSHLRRKRLESRYATFMEQMQNPLFITLTIKNYDLGRLTEMINKLLESFKKLRKTDLFSTIYGGIRALEVTFNPKHETWHAHLHILADIHGSLFDSETGEFKIPHHKLSAEWLEITGDSNIVWITRANPKNLKEIVKYVSKVKTLIKHPESFAELLEALHGRRLVQPFGGWYGTKLKDEDEGNSKCPKCGGTVLVFLGLFYPDHPEFAPTWETLEAQERVTGDRR